jgi:hypothetical protein
MSLHIAQPIAYLHLHFEAAACMGTPKVSKELKDHSDNEGGGIRRGGEGSGMGGIGGGGV